MKTNTHRMYGILLRHLFYSLPISMVLWGGSVTAAVPTIGKDPPLTVAEAIQPRSQDEMRSQPHTRATPLQTLEQLKQTLAQAQQNGDQQRTALTLQQLGTAYHALGATQLSINHHQKALSLYQLLQDPLQEAVTLRALGDTYAMEAAQQRQVFQSRFHHFDTYLRAGPENIRQAKTKAQSFYEQSLKRSEQLHAPSQSARTLNQMGQLFDLDDASDTRDAQNLFKQALQQAQEAQDQPQEALALQLLGQTHATWRQKKETWQAFEQSLQRSKALGDRSGEARTLLAMAKVYHRQFGNPESALAHYQQALKISEAAGDLSQSIQALEGAGESLLYLGQQEQALAQYQRALSLANRLGHRPTTAQTLIRLGWVHNNLRQSRQALNGFNQAIATFQSASQFYEQLGDAQKATDFHLLRVRYLVSAGKESYGLNQKQNALQYFAKARQYFQERGDAQGEVNVLKAISFIFRNSFADDQQALGFLTQAQRVYQLRGDRISEADLLAGNIAPHLRYRLKDLPKALAAYRQAVQRYWALAQYEQAGFRLAYSIAEIYQELDQPEQIEVTYQQAHRAYQKAGDLQKESSFLIKWGQYLYQAGDRERAHPIFNQAHQIFESKNSSSVTRKQQAKALRDIAQIYANDLKNKAKAIEFLRQAIPLWAAANDPKEQAQAWVSIGQYHLDLQHPQAAVLAFQHAEQVQQKAGDLSAEAWTLIQIGQAYANQRDFQTALQYYQQVLTHYQSENRPARQKTRLIVLTLLKMGQLHAYAGNNEAGLRFCDRALSAAKTYVTNRWEVAEVVEIGKLCYSLGGHIQAAEIFKLYRDFYRSIDDPFQEAFALRRIGQYYADVGALDQTLLAFNQARQVYQKLGDLTEEATTLRAIGSQYIQLGNQQKAAEFYTQAFAIAQRAGGLRLQAEVANDSGRLYRQLEDYPKALSYLKRSRLYTQQLGDHLQAFRTLSEIATTHHQARQFTEALQTYEATVKLGLELSENNTVITALLGMGEIYTQQNQPQHSLKVYKQTLALSQQWKSPRRPTIFRLLGQTYLNLNQPKLALKHYQQALSWSEKTAYGKAPALLGLAKANRALGRLETALTQIKAALPLIEEQRTRQTTSTERQQYFAEQQDYYEFYTDLLMELHQKNPSQGYDAQAFHASERSRARSLLDLLSEAKTDIRKGVDPDLVAQEQRLQQQLDAVEQRRIQIYNSPDSTSEQKSDIEQERQYLLRQYQIVQADIRKKSPSYAALTQPQPFTVQQIQTQLLDDDTLLLQYALGEKQSYVWAITKTSLHSYPLPARSIIEAAATGVYKRWRDPSKTNSRGTIIVAEKAASTTSVVSLSKLLLDPVSTHLDQQRLLIVSDGALNYLPFSALSKPESAESDQPIPLIAEHEIVTVPSASSLAVLRQEAAKRRPAPKTIAIMADPVFSAEDKRTQASHRSQRSGQHSWSHYLLRRAAQSLDIGVWQRLPGTRREAEAILALVPGSEQTSAFGFEANRAAASDPRLNQYRMVHFATHGLLNSENPELSGIVLSMVDRQGEATNGFLRLHDVFNLDLAAELVVLSACQTGLGQRVRGEGLVGLTRGFMYAGTPRVLVSLWNVDDAATAELMSRFYRAMLQERLPATAALRVAQLEMQTQTQWQAPYYWAAFTLQGDWQ
ncbi:MAG: tetratricopeptide repeat protein [Thermosynechococcaceae cyanobacterium]